MKNKKAQTARLAIRHQDYRLRCLLNALANRERDAESAKRTLEDIDAKMKEIAIPLGMPKDDSIKESITHYLNSFKEYRQRCIEEMKKLKKKKAA
jgi:hypothetical protein